MENRLLKDHEVGGLYVIRHLEDTPQRFQVLILGPFWLDSTL